MSTVDTAATIERALSRIGARVEVTSFSSGAVDLVARRGSVLVAAQGTADGQWGFSVNPDPDDGMTGHDRVTDDARVALVGIVSAFR